MIWFTPQAQVVKKSCQPQKFISVKILSDFYLLLTDFFSLYLIYNFSFWLIKTNFFKQSLQYFSNTNAYGDKKPPGEDCLFNILPNIVFAWNAIPCFYHSFTGKEIFCVFNGGW